MNLKQDDARRLLKFKNYLKVLYCSKVPIERAYIWNFDEFHVKFTEFLDYLLYYYVFFSL